jgi:hypothetical protein
MNFITKNGVFMSSASLSESRIPVVVTGPESYARSAVAVLSAPTATVGGHVVQSRSDSSYARPVPVSFARSVHVPVTTPVLVSTPPVHTYSVLTPAPSGNLVVMNSSGSCDCKSSNIALAVLALITGIALMILGVTGGAMPAFVFGAALAIIGGIVIGKEIWDITQKNKPANADLPVADSKVQSKEQKRELGESKEAPGADLNTDGSRASATATAAGQADPQAAANQPPPPYQDK